jgi:hypothetical protein
MVVSLALLTFQSVYCRGERLSSTQARNRRSLWRNYAAEVVVPAKRRLPIDLTGVVRAMDDEARARREHLLDTHTGELITVPRATLDGGPVDALSPEERAALPLAKRVLRAKPGRFVTIPHRPPPDRYEIMQRFVGSVVDPDLRRNLQRVLGGNAPFRRFMELLADDVAEEARWQQYGATARQFEAREWLESLDIEPV